jgi:hypothetical protein
MSIEQRNSFRIQMPEGQKHAQLRIEGRTYDVQLVDASATGVAVACPLTVALEIDDSCELLAACGNGFIRVVRKEVFADGILIGAVRIGDKPETTSLWGQLTELISWPMASFPGNSPLKIGLVIGMVCVVVAAAYVACFWNRGSVPTVTVTAPVDVTVNTPVEVPEPQQQVTPDDVQRVLQQVNELLPEIKPEVSESDQRALRIFEQQKQLLSPDMVRRLRLSPSQENQIERALQAAEAAADPSHPEFWETIRRTELQILRILTPAQVRSWRQLQSDT